MPEPKKKPKNLSTRAQIDALNKQRREVKAIATGHKEELSDLLQASRTTLRGRLTDKDMQAAKPNGFAVRKMVDETRDVLNVFEDKAKDAFRKRIDAAETLAAKHAAREFKRISGERAPLERVEPGSLLTEKQRERAAERFGDYVSEYRQASVDQVRSDLMQAMRSEDQAEGGLARAITHHEGPIASAESDLDRLALTEVHGVYSKAKDRAIAKLAKASGIELERAWFLNPYKAHCETCLACSEKRVGIGEPWVVSVGGVTKKIMRPSAHPRCGCIVETVPKKKAKRDDE